MILTSRYPLKYYKSLSISCITNMAMIIFLPCVTVLLSTWRETKRLQKLYKATCTGCYFLGISTVTFRTRVVMTHTHIYEYIFRQGLLKQSRLCRATNMEQAVSKLNGLFAIATCYWDCPNHRITEPIGPPRSFSPTNDWTQPCQLAHIAKCHIP